MRPFTTPCALIWRVLAALGFIAGFALAGPAFAQQTSYAPIVREDSRTGNSVTLEITFPELQFDTIIQSGVMQGLMRVSPFTGLSIVGSSGEYTLPLASGQGSATLISQEVKDYSLGLQLSTQQAKLTAIDRSAYPILSEPAALGLGIAKIEYLGKYSGADASRLRIGVMIYERERNLLRQIRKIKVRINTTNLTSSKITDLASASKSAQLARSRAMGKNRNSVQQAVEKQGVISDDGRVHKFVIDRGGLYKLTYDDFKNYGIDADAIDLPTLRIVHNDVQVPIYVFDKQDGRFNPGDYIEFFGERKLLKYESKFKDMWFDPYTQESIYYLVWGTQYSPVIAGGIKRMVEESGEVRVGDPTKFVYLRDSSFPSHIHFERNNWYEFLSNTDLNELSSLRDHWYTAEIRRGGSITVDTQAPFPDARKNSLISIRAGLHGFSTFDRGFVDYEGNPVPDVPNEQEASISVNGKLVLWDTWDSQQLKFISTDTAAQLGGGVAPTTSYLNGYDREKGFPLTFTVQHTKNTDVQSRFGLNWIDLTYDRTYNAWRNEIEFGIPTNSRHGFYQFTIGSFSRSDISIYRKGVSKISNVFISAVTPGAKSIQCIFQAPVSGPSEIFVAVSDSNKLKPKKYYTDNYLDLRKTSNEADYLVISSRAFLNKDNYGIESSPLNRYIQRATRKGMKGKLIDVANIYDEFNGGSQSPEAIRNFLSYAYNYWAVPPKHVVFIGRVDDVPTPKIQSFRLGSISSDAWYAMVDGNDLLPDLAVGRVPVLTGPEAEAYLTKMEKYESDPSPSPMWKNQSYFISGNFALGSDFPSQVTGLLNSSVPRTVFAERAGLNIDLPYYTTHTQVIDRFNKGLKYVQFMGHGGHRAWDDYVDAEGRAVLVQDDVPLMNNPNASYPFVTSLTCFTGSFEGEEPGLIPLLLNRQDGGAIGGFATSSFGFRDADYRIAESLLPSVYDTLPATWGERVFRAKTEYYLKYGGFGMLIPQTLQYAYYYLGDPSVSPFIPTQGVSPVLSTRVSNAGGQVTITGKTTIESGTARIELVNEENSPLPQAEHYIDNISVQNGSFTVTDNVPSNLTTEAGTYKITVASPDKSYAIGSSDLSFAKARVTQVELTPRSIVPNEQTTITAAVQVPAGVSSVNAEVTIFEKNNLGVETQVGSPVTVAMSPSEDKYVGTFNTAALQNGMRVEIRVTATATGGQMVSSVPFSTIVGASSDPAAYASSNHNTFKTKLIATPTGLAWQQQIFNWGSVEARNVTVELVDTRPNPESIRSSVVIPSIGAKSSVTVLLPVTSTTLDSSALKIRVVAEAGTSPLNYRDSSTKNNETTVNFTTLGAVAYLKSSGASSSFDGGDVAVELGPNALQDVQSQALRVERLYEPVRNMQPDIQFIEIEKHESLTTHAIRVVGDSIGAVTLDQSVSTRKLSIRVTDNTPGLTLYRQDNRSKLWTIVPTTREGDNLIAKITALGTFAVGYHTDQIKPVVEMTVEGQVFVDKGDVPEKPRLSIVIQDANGIDITTGKTVVKIDGQVVDAQIVSSLDTQRTQTAINLKLEPKLSNGPHTISVTAFDNNGLQSEKQLEVNVSNTFVIQELGIYPNPFATVMFLAYEIKGIPFAEEVELNIYTVSGKLIKTHRFPDADPEKSFGFVKGGTGTPTSLGYHEVWWDGRDNDGIDVANGVYFYRLKVRTERETKEITGKIARIR